MIKQQSSLTSILAAAAIAGSALLVAVNPAEACTLNKVLKSGKWGAIAAAGVAAVAGLGAAGITLILRQDPSEMTDMLGENAEGSSEYMIETVLRDVTVNEEAPAAEAPEKELTLIK